MVMARKVGTFVVCVILNSKLTFIYLRHLLTKKSCSTYIFFPKSIQHDGSRLNKTSFGESKPLCCFRQWITSVLYTGRGYHWHARFYAVSPLTFNYVCMRFGFIVQKYYSSEDWLNNHGGIFPTLTIIIINSYQHSSVDNVIPHH